MEHAGPVLQGHAATTPEVMSVHHALTIQLVRLLPILLPLLLACICCMLYWWKPWNVMITYDAAQPIPPRVCLSSVH